MPVLNWSAVYSVSVRAMDEQHKVLVDTTNQLYDAMRAGKGNQELGQIIQKLIDYTDGHFKDEEKLLATHRYPNLAQHKVEHEAFIRKVFEFSRSLQDGKMALSITVGNFLKDWLVNHIQKEDKQYSAFLNAKGVN